MLCSSAAQLHLSLGKSNQGVKLSSPQATCAGQGYVLNDNGVVMDGGATLLFGPAKGTGQPRHANIFHSFQQSLSPMLSSRLTESPKKLMGKANAPFVPLMPEMVLDAFPLCRSLVPGYLPAHLSACAGMHTAPLHSAGHVPRPDGDRTEGHAPPR
eukprot:scaffold304292_cov21-Tisochrysis_lutea.AAC.2